MTPPPSPQDAKPPVPTAQQAQQPAQPVSAVPLYDALVVDLGDPFDSVENVVMREQDQRIKQAMAWLHQVAQEGEPPEEQQGGC